MALELDAKTTALVLIDLEHGIVGMDVKPHTSADVVARCAKLAEAVRKAGGTVVYVHVLLHDMLRLPADQPMGRSGGPKPPPEASELVPEAGYQEKTDILIAKRQWGAFHATSLDQQLRRRGIKTVIMGGIATNMGVESTARAAVEHGYAVVFAEDAMSTLSPEMQEFAVKSVFPLIGRVRSTDEVIAALQG